MNAGSVVTVPAASVNAEPLRVTDHRKLGVSPAMLSVTLLVRFIGTLTLPVTVAGPLMPTAGGMAASTEWANSDVLPAGSVAVTLMASPAALAAASVRSKLALPLASVASVADPR